MKKTIKDIIHNEVITNLKNYIQYYTKKDTTLDDIDSYIKHFYSIEVYNMLSLKEIFIATSNFIESLED
jgi:hypothetical protein